ADEGMKVHPLDGSRERSGFTGGYIVQPYGSHKPYKIDAIQLEFGGDYRAKENVKDTAAKLAAVIAHFSKLYLQGDLPKKENVPLPKMGRAFPPGAWLHADETTARRAAWATCSS